MLVLMLHPAKGVLRGLRVCEFASLWYSDVANGKFVLTLFPFDSSLTSYFLITCATQGRAEMAS